MVSSSISRGVMDSPLMVIGIILPARVILHWPEPLCVKSMRELHMLCVKLQLKMSCSGGNFLVNSVLVDTNMDTSLLDTTQSQIVTMLNLKQRSLYAPYQIKRSHAQNGLQENGNLLMG
ncbi:TPA: hypothetical protein ACULIC_000255 [Escherichia coli]